MATRKPKSAVRTAPPVLAFDSPDTHPSYVNNVRIKSTSDNVFIDFGFVDPFAAEGSASAVLQRIVMNRTTFSVFAKHVAAMQAEIGTSTTDVPLVIMSRCPPKVED